MLLISTRNTLQSFLTIDEDEEMNKIFRVDKGVRVMPGVFDLLTHTLDRPDLYPDI